MRIIVPSVCQPWLNASGAWRTCSNNTAALCFGSTVALHSAAGMAQHAFLQSGTTCGLHHLCERP